MMEKRIVDQKWVTYKHNFVTKRKKPISHYFHGSAFLKALADIEVPAE